MHTTNPIRKTSNSNHVGLFFCQFPPNTLNNELKKGYSSGDN